MNKRKMYNLLVSGVDGAWDGTTYAYDLSRFLEYTDEDISSRFEQLNESNIAALMAMPCVFAYEGLLQPLRVGWLTDVKVKKRQIDITFRFDTQYVPLNALDTPGLVEKLGFQRWERNRTHWAVKDVDLFKVLREELIQVPADPEPPAAAVSVSDLPKTEPTTIGKVSTVSEFIDTVLGLQADGKQIFYRGHSNRTTYKLAPTLFRKDTNGVPRHLQSEHQMYRELLISNSKDFQEDVNTLDRLVRMQHFGLPTRLLDISSNPLIALYFTCKSGRGQPKDGQMEGEIPGEVVIFRIDPSRIKYFDSDTASCMANLARLPQGDKDSIDYGIDDLTQFNDQAAMKKLLHFVREEKPYFEPRMLQTDLRSVICVKSKRSNDRISSQSGAFLLFGQEAQFREDGMPEIGITVERVEVRGKASIIRELDQLNINESTVFPYIENSAQYIAQKFSL